MLPIRLLAAAAALAILPSCLKVNYDERFEITANGSGSIEVSLDFPALQTRLAGHYMKALEDAVERTPGIGLKDAWIRRQNFQTARAHAILTFQYPSDLEKLRGNLLDVLAESPPEGPALDEFSNILPGMIDWKFESWNDIKVNRSIDLPALQSMVAKLPKLPGPINNLVTPKQGDSQFRFRVVLPDAKPNNAQSSSADGRELTWQIDPFQPATQPLAMTWHLAPPIPPWAWGIIYGVPCGLVSGGLFIFIRRKIRGGPARNASPSPRKSGDTPINR